MSDRRRFGHVNVVCMYSIACIGGKNWKRGRAVGVGRARNMGQLTIGKRPTRMGVRNHV